MFHFGLVRNVGKKSHLTSSLDSGGKLSLVKSAVAANTSGENLSSLGNELSELSYVLVIDLRNLVLAEDANLLSSVVGTECGTLCIVSFHLDLFTFPTHDFCIAPSAVSLAERGLLASLRREDFRRWEFLRNYYPVCC